MADRVPPKADFSIVVRRRHYETALPSSTSRCVLAVAFQEAFPDAGPIRVGAEDLAVTGPDSLQEWAHDGSDIVSRFDNGYITHDNAPAVHHVTLTYHAELSYGEVERRDGSL